MPSQMGVVTRSKRKRDQIAELNARQSLLPQMMANKQRQEDLIRYEETQKLQTDQWDKDYALAEDRQAWARKSYKKTQNATDRANRVGMGLEASKLGLNINQQYGGKTIGDTGLNANSLFSKSPNTANTAVDQWSYNKDAGGAGSAINEFQVGSFVGGGLTGYGASRLVDKKKKGKRFALGAGAGALAGFLSGGAGGALAGGIGGALGSLF